MQHTITPSTLHSFCRTCLNELHPPHMYNIQNMDVQIRHWLQDTTVQDPVTEDDYPKCVCQSCRDKLEHFLEFHQLCSRSRKVFQDILGKREKPILLSLDQNDMGVVEETTCSETRNKINVNTDWLEFDFVAIPRSLTELQSKTCKQEMTEKAELLTPVFRPTYQKRGDSVDSYERNVDDEYSPPHDVYVKNNLKLSTNSNDPSEKSKVRSTIKLNKPKKNITPASSKRNSSPDLKPSEDKPQHVCEECGKVYPSLARLTEHQYSHKPLEDYPFHCTECSKAFKHRQTFNAHQLRHAGIKNYQCPYCDVKKTTKSELRTHINSHTKERQWLCPKCPQIFSSAANLRRHDEVVHQGIRRFACRHCKQTFGKQESLKHHEMRHTGEKPHVCSECGKRFIQLVSMKTHMKTHNKYLS